MFQNIISHPLRGRTEGHARLLLTFITRSEARRIIIDLLWTRQLAEAGYLAELFLNISVLNPDDYRFVQKMLGLARNDEVDDISEN